MVHRFIKDSIIALQRGRRFIVLRDEMDNEFGEGPDGYFRMRALCAEHDCQLQIHDLNALLVFKDEGEAP